MAEPKTAERKQASEQAVPPPPAKAEVALLAQEPSFLKNEQPVWFRLNESQKELLRRKTEGKLTDSHLAQGVELCVAYGLDPYSQEIHFGMSKSGKLMILTGRDGFRKIVQRNGCEMECDAVHEKDVFSYKRLIDDRGFPYHEITHEVRGWDRGLLRLSYARVYERRTLIERGFFVAPLEEYDPGAVGYDTPWKRQKSVMIIAAAERQAARQAMPLSGLLIEGEEYVIDANAIDVEESKSALGAGNGGAERGWGELSTDTVASVEAVLLRAEKLGHAGLANKHAAQMSLAGKDDTAAERWVLSATAQLDRMERDPEASAEKTEIVREEDVPAAVKIDEITVRFKDAILPDYYPAIKDADQYARVISVRDKGPDAMLMLAQDISEGLGQLPSDTANFYAKLALALEREAEELRAPETDVTAGAPDPDDTDTEEAAIIARLEAASEAGDQEAFVKAEKELGALRAKREGPETLPGMGS